MTKWQFDVHCDYLEITYKKTKVFEDFITHIGNSWKCTDSFDRYGFYLERRKKTFNYTNELNIIADYPDSEDIVRKVRIGTLLMGSPTYWKTEIYIQFDNGIFYNPELFALALVIPDMMGLQIVSISKLDIAVDSDRDFNNYLRTQILSKRGTDYDLILFDSKKTNDEILDEILYINKGTRLKKNLINSLYFKRAPLNKKSKGDLEAVVYDKSNEIMTKTPQLSQKKFNFTDISKAYITQSLRFDADKIYRFEVRMRRSREIDRTRKLLGFISPVVEAYDIKTRKNPYQCREYISPEAMLGLLQSKEWLFRMFNITLFRIFHLSKARKSIHLMELALKIPNEYFSDMNSSLPNKRE